MLENGKAKSILIFLAGGILVPALIGFAVEKYFEADHGVLVADKADVWKEPTFETALDRLAGHRSLNLTHLSSFVWIRRNRGWFFLIKGVGQRRFFVDGTELREMRGTPYAIQTEPTPEGLHHIELICQPSNFASEIVFMWTTDFVKPIAIPHDCFYTKSVGPALRYLDLAAKWLRILTRLNILLFAAVCVFFFGKWLLRRTGLFPQPSATRMSWGLIALFAVIFCVRVAGIEYQLYEGLHPDERMVDNAVRLFRTGDLEPRQYFWSSGYEYLVALHENLGHWVLGRELPPHLTARSLSAVFSWLSCLMLYSIARKLFDGSTAFWTAVFLGFTLMPVELAHQGIVESSMVCMFLLAFRALLELDANTAATGFAAAGVIAGLAMGFKQTAGLIVLPALAQFLLILREGRFRAIAMKACAWGIGCVIGYLILSPYSLLDFHHFWATQQWQLRSQEGQAGSEMFFAETSSVIGAHSLALAYLRDGMGPAIVAAAILGCGVLIWKSKKNALLILTPALIYALICSLSSTPPYHYVLLLCPMLALLASIAVLRVSSMLPFRRIVLPLIGIALLAPSLYQTVLLEKALQGRDMRNRMEQWCNMNLPPGSRVDYEMFGPRFLMPFLNTYRLSLFKRDPWDQYLINRQPEYYVYDSITAGIFDAHPGSVEASWFHALRQSGKVVQEFHGDPFRIYNPDLILYQIGQKKTLPWAANQ